MPIGWETDDGRVVHRRIVTSREPDPAPVRWRDQVASLVQTGAAIVAGSEPVHREVIPTVWTRWTTVGDERVARFAVRTPAGSGGWVKARRRRCIRIADAHAFMRLRRLL